MNEERPYRPVVPWYRHPVGICLAAVLGVLVLMWIVGVALRDEFPTGRAVE